MALRTLRQFKILNSHRDDVVGKARGAAPIENPVAN